MLLNFLCQLQSEVDKLASAGLLDMDGNQVVAIGDDSLAGVGGEANSLVVGEVAGGGIDERSVEVHLYVLVVVKNHLQLGQFLFGEIEAHRLAEPYVVGGPACAVGHVSQSIGTEAGVAHHPFAVVKVGFLPSGGRLCGGVAPTLRTDIGGRQDIDFFYTFVLDEIAVGLVDFVDIGLDHTVVGHHTVDLNLHIGELRIDSGRHTLVGLVVSQFVEVVADGAVILCCVFH